MYAGEKHGINARKSIYICEREWVKMKLASLISRNTDDIIAN